MVIFNSYVKLPEGNSYVIFKALKAGATQVIPSPKSFAQWRGHPEPKAEQDVGDLPWLAIIGHQKTGFSFNKDMTKNILSWEQFSVAEWMSSWYVDILSGELT